jgi:hypothetical protein
MQLCVILPCITTLNQREQVLLFVYGELATIIHIRSRAMMYSTSSTSLKYTRLQTLATTDDDLLLAHLSSTPGASSMSYQVYKLSYDKGTNCNHCVLFIETEEYQKGTVFDVIGDLQVGMKQELIMHVNPVNLAGYQSREFLGTVDMMKLVEADALIRTTPAPWKQFDDQWRELRPDRPVYGPEQWLQKALEALRNRGILRN